MVLGKIVAANSHIDYICQIYRHGEIPNPPKPDDYGFGTFVRIDVDKDRWLVGLIYNTILRNPEFGHLGPRLSPVEELLVFAPDYLQEKMTLASIIAIGMMSTTGTIHQGVPPIAAGTDTLVAPLTKEEIRRFHESKQEGNTRCKMNYMSTILAQSSPLMVPLLKGVVEMLQGMFPEQSSSFNLLLRELMQNGQAPLLGDGIF